MANYSMSGHTLEFQNGYQTLVVKDATDDVVASHDLTSTTVSVGADGTNYIVSEDSSYSALHNWDTNGGDELNFNNERLGGIIIVDVRDINRTGNGIDPGTYEFSYDLTVCAVKIWYESGAFGFKVYVADLECFQIEPVA